MTTFGDQVREYGGAPVGSGRFSSPWATHYFVDGDNGTAGAGGLRPDKATATVAQAISLAGYGDVIYVRPKKPGGSTSGDASDPGFYTADTMVIPFAKHQLAIIGVNSASTLYGPFIWPTSGIGLDVYASAFHIENMTIHAESVTYAIYLRGISGYATKAGSCGASIENCVIGYGQTLVEGGGDTVFRNCHFRNAIPLDIKGNAAGVGPIRRDAVIGCWFGANNGAAVATAYVTLEGSISEFLMKDCHFDQPTAVDEYINSSGSVDGLISNCYFADDAVTWGADAGDEIRIASGTLCPSGCYDNAGSLIATGT